MPRTTSLLALALSFLVLGSGTMAYAKPSGPAQEALAQRSNPTVPGIQNRFFIKKRRFEVAPMFGFVPNNAMAWRFVGSVTGAYYFSEKISIQVLVGYAPSFGTGDLKGLPVDLIKQNQNNPDYVQPIRKTTFTSAVSAQYTPWYGKINLLGETVASFDTYFIGGVGLHVNNNYFGTYDSASAGDSRPITLDKQSSQVLVGPVLGAGLNLYLSQTIALKFDMRLNFTIDEKPQYNRDIPSTEKRLYSDFVAGVGVGFFFPPMKKRAFTY